MSATQVTNAELAVLYCREFSTPLTIALTMSSTISHSSQVMWAGWDVVDAPPLCVATTRYTLVPRLPDLTDLVADEDAPPRLVQRLPDCRCH